MLDFSHNAAIVPVSGDDKLVFTHSMSVGAYVAASLDQEVWEEASFIIGDRLSFNEVIKMAEKVKGEKFNVQYVNLEDIRARKIPELEWNRERHEILPKVVVDSIFGIVGEAVVGGFLDIGKGKEENDMFNVRLMSVEDFFQLG